MKTCYIILGVAYALSACSVNAPTPEPVHDDDIASLMACVMGDVCTVPAAQVQREDGVVLESVSVRGTDGLSYTFIFSSDRQFRIMMNDSNQRVLLIKDNNLDGKVDGIIGMTEKMSEPQSEPVHEGSDAYVHAQNLYLDAMSLSRTIVPKEVRDAMSNTPMT